MKRIFFSIAAAIAAVIGSFGLWTGVASAHHPVITGHTTCQNDGTWTVQWTVGNSETIAGRDMTFDSAKVNGASTALSPANVAPSGSAAGTSTHNSATNSATLDVTARWAYATPNVVASTNFTVSKPDQCVAPTTTTTVAPTTTTVAPTTTIAEVTTTIAEVTTTVGAVATTVTEHKTLVTPAPAPQADGQVDAVALTSGAVGQTLPTTGKASVPLVVAGVGCLLMGALIVVAARRYTNTV